MSNELEQRIYKKEEVITFRKTNERFGGLSNMAAGYPLEIKGIKIRTSEALYQACRYPDYPEIQKEILAQKSPMTAKMISKKYRNKTRNDWDSVKLQVMRWSIRLKLLQNWSAFSELLLSTGARPIVEESRKDRFWGAILYSDGVLVGANALGRLLMELRQEILGNRISVGKCILNSPNISEFKFLGGEIGNIGIIITEDFPKFKENFDQTSLF